MTAGTPHILMSVSKSLLGLLAGVVASRGDLRPDRPVTDVIPEVAGTAYQGATIRHLLDMRAGMPLDEDYLADSGPIVQYRKATGWNPLAPGETPSGPASASIEPDGPRAAARRARPLRLAEHGSARVGASSGRPDSGTRI